MAGTAAGQLIGVFASPLLSRFYSPSEFGVFAVVNSLALTIGTITALRYESAIPLPDDDEDAAALAVASLICCLATALTCQVVIAVSGQELAEVMGDPGLTTWLHWIPLIALAIGVFRVLNQWALRSHRYTATARRNVLQSASSVAIQLVAGWRGAGSAGLIAGLGGGQWVGAASLSLGSGLFRRRPNQKQLARVFKRYRRFPLLLAPAGLINASGAYLPLILVAGVYGTTAAGWLGFTQRILAFPVALLGQSVAQVYLSELASARRQRTGQEEHLFWVASKRLSAVGALGAAVLLAAGPALFRVVFGATWTESGEMARALSISIAAQLVASSVSQTLIVFERNALQLMWDLARLAVVCGAVLTCAAAKTSVQTCIWSISISSTLAYAVSWELSRRTVSSTRNSQSFSST